MAVVVVVDGGGGAGWCAKEGEELGSVWAVARSSWTSGFRAPMCNVGVWVSSSV